MAGLAQQHESRLFQKFVIGYELVVDIEVRRTLVLLSAELARVVP